MSAGRESDRMDSARIPAERQASRAPRYENILKHRLASRRVFLARVGRNGAVSLAIVGCTLLFGTVGYVALTPFGWVDAFHQAALLMSGMGPLEESGWSTAAKLFDSLYALFCGIGLLVSYGVLFAPILHRLLHRFHLDDVADER